MTDDEVVHEMVFNKLKSKYNGEISKERHDEFIKFLLVTD